MRKKLVKETPRTHSRKMFREIRTNSWRWEIKTNLSEARIENVTAESSDSRRPDMMVRVRGKTKNKSNTQRPRCQLWHETILFINSNTGNIQCDNDNTDKIHCHTNNTGKTTLSDQTQAKYTVTTPVWYSNNLQFSFCPSFKGKRNMII